MTRLAFVFFRFAVVNFCFITIICCCCCCFCHCGQLLPVVGVVIVTTVVVVVVAVACWLPSSPTCVACVELLKVHSSLSQWSGAAVSAAAAAAATTEQAGRCRYLNNRVFISYISLETAFKESLANATAAHCLLNIILKLASIALQHIGGFLI